MISGSLTLTEDIMQHADCTFCLGFELSAWSVTFTQHMTRAGITVWPK